jgi:hypothetical protein
LAAAVFVVEVTLRKAAQFSTLPLHPDVSVLLSGLFVYSLHYTTVAFSAPNIDLKDSHDACSLRTLVTLGLHPLVNTWIALVHQSDMWMRFRCWLKCIAPPILLCHPISRRALPIEADVFRNGHGVTNAHPDYRHTKVPPSPSFQDMNQLQLFLQVGFDIDCAFATMFGYGCFLTSSWVFREGLNVHHFPYNSDDSINGIIEKPYGETEFRTSLKFAAVVFFVVWFGFGLYARFLHLFFPVGRRHLRNTLHRFMSSKLRVDMLLILTSNFICVISTLMDHSRVWYLSDADAGIGPLCSIANASRW